MLRQGGDVGRQARDVMAEFLVGCVMERFDPLRKFSMRLVLTAE